jgi:hypothetical protein
MPARTSASDAQRSQWSITHGEITWLANISLASSQRSANLICQWVFSCYQRWTDPSGRLPYGILLELDRHGNDGLWGLCVNVPINNNATMGAQVLGKEGGGRREEGGG